MYEPKTGDIIFFRSKFSWKKPLSLISVLIRPIAKIPYNHVEIIGENWGKYYSFGAQERGFLPEPVFDRIDGYDILISRPRFEIDNKDFNIKMNDLTGVKKYDFKGLFYDQLVLNLFHRWKGAKTEKEALKRLYCYEAYWYMFKDKFSGLWWEQYPKDTIYTAWGKTIFKGKFDKKSMT